MTPTLDPTRAVGEFVSLEHAGRMMLGEIIRIEFRGDPERLPPIATVRHFNGEPWPFRVTLNSLTWIRQA